MKEGELVRWHPPCDGHEFEQAPGVGDGQGRLACCSPWGRKESDMTERLNNTKRAIEKPEGEALGGINPAAPLISVESESRSGVSNSFQPAWTMRSKDFSGPVY